LRDQTADHQAIARASITRPAERPSSRARRNAIYPSVASGRTEIAPDKSRVPVRSP
jgi:hypothetical protein